MKGFIAKKELSPEQREELLQALEFVEIDRESVTPATPHTTVHFHRVVDTLSFSLIPLPRNNCTKAWLNRARIAARSSARVMYRTRTSRPAAVGCRFTAGAAETDCTR